MVWGARKGVPDEMTVEPKSEVGNTGGRDGQGGRSRGRGECLPQWPQVREPAASKASEQTLGGSMDLGVGTQTHGGHGSILGPKVPLRAFKQGLAMHL